MLCPVCGVAMLADKTRDDSETFDVFRCLHCDSTISLAAKAKPPEPLSEIYAFQPLLKR